MLCDTYLKNLANKQYRFTDPQTAIWPPLKICRTLGIGSRSVSDVDRLFSMTASASHSFDKLIRRTPMMG